MRFVKSLAVVFVLIFAISACGKAPTEAPDIEADTVRIVLNDNGTTVNGETAGTDNTSSVYTANDIVYYESGKDFTYGEGSENDAHSADEAKAHTVIHIAEAGTYSISGKLSKGQIAVDLGEGAEENPDAVVTLILDGVDISCSVAPAVIFYNVYECATDEATKDVDTSKAGANVTVADGTDNLINGSYVARIYKPDSVVLNEDKTEVEDAKKLHKYDGAFYSKMSMNINGEKDNSGILNINADNEGLDSEMHLTINGGNININSGNDGINTNEDGVSVTTVNGGNLKIRVSGDTGEGDGIDSNGWLVINGGTVIASGHMLDRIEDGGQNYAVFSFAQKQSGNEAISLKNKDGNSVAEARPENAYSVLIFSSPDLTAGTYTLWSDNKQLAGNSGGMANGHGMRPDEMTPPEGETHQFPGNIADTENFTRPEGEKPPEGFEPPEGFTHPSGETPPEKPDGSRPEKPFGDRHDIPDNNPQESSSDFIIKDGGNMFSGIMFIS